MALLTKTCSILGATNTDLELDALALAFDAKQQMLVDDGYSLIGSFQMNSFDDGAGGKCTTFAQTFQKSVVEVE